MDGKRAERRMHNRRAKERAKRVMRLWYGHRESLLDPRTVGVNASTHCRPCACWMCQEDRREVPAPRERAFDYSDFV